MPPDPQTLPARWSPAAARRRALGPAAAVALVLLAAWVVPPMLDWGRFRTAIAAIAAARLGRPAAIDGEISLRLLPQAVLTANEVTLADQGDGISVRVGALRLQVATLPLLAGRLVVRDLVLSAPVLRLPWSLPDGIVHPVRPQVPHAFAARIENGTLQVGEAEVTGITAAIHGGPAAATVTALAAQPPASGAVPPTAFAAEGFAAAAGRNWRFTGALGAPDADGVSALDVTVRGQGPVRDTVGSLQATLADAVVQGRLRASGPDLSLLMPASAQAWRLDAPFVAGADRIEADTIALALGGAPAEGALVLSLAAPARLDGTLHADAIDLDGWAALLRRGLGQPARRALLRATLPLHLTLSADRATLLGGALQALHGVLVSDGTGLVLQAGAAVLPGQARLASPRLRLVPADAAATLAVTGRATLSAPDLRATLAWLAGLAPRLATLPDGVLRTAELAADATFSPSGISLSDLSGRLDGSTVGGSLSLTGPALSVNLAFERLALDPWLAGALGAPSLDSLARGMSGPASMLHVTARSADWHGLALEGVTLDAGTGPAGPHVDRAGATLAGAALTLSGAVTPDGHLHAARVALDTLELARLLPLVPTAWRVAPGLWHGPGRVAVAAEGPPQALAVQVRADVGDLVAEAEATRDTRAGVTTATLTLRHPGAPRLLAALGLPGGQDAARAWLDTGSLALRTDIVTRPGHLTLSDADLDAAALRLTAQLEADWTGARPRLTGRINADQLALPGTLPGQDWAAMLAGWDGRLDITAARLLVGQRHWLDQLNASLSARSGAVGLDRLSATLLGGRLSGQATARAAPDGGLSAITLPGVLTGCTRAGPPVAWPVELVAGRFDLGADLTADTASLPGVSGRLAATLRDGVLAGIDLAALPRPAGRRPLAPSGSTTGLAGRVDAVVTRGHVALAPARLTAPAGTLDLSGGSDAATGSVDLRLVLAPALPARGSLALRLVGQGASATLTRAK